MVWTWLWGAFTGTVLIVAVPEWLGVTPVPAGDIEGGIIAVVLSLATTGAGGLTAWALGAVQRPVTSWPLVATTSQRFEVPRPPLLPAPGSAARRPMRQLNEALAGSEHDQRPRWTHGGLPSRSEF